MTRSGRRLLARGLRHGAVLDDGPAPDGTPQGLVARDDLPGTGTVRLRMALRRGLDRQVELAAAQAVETFVRTRQQLRLVPSPLDVPANSGA